MLEEEAATVTTWIPAVHTTFAGTFKLWIFGVASSTDDSYFLSL